MREFEIERVGGSEECGEDADSWIKEYASDAVGAEDSEDDEDGVSGEDSVQEIVSLTIKTPSGINIPGFPIESIILGGASVIVILWITKRAKPVILT